MKGVGAKVNDVQLYDYGLTRHGITTYESEIYCAYNPETGMMFACEVPILRYIIGARGKEWDWGYTFVKGERRAYGCHCPLDDVPGLLEIPIPKDLIEMFPIDPKMTTEDKGWRASMIIAMFIEREGLSLLKGKVKKIEIINNKTEQVKGKDLKILLDKQPPKYIECKNDYNGGVKKWSGVRTFYIQVWEKNPDRLH
jgi:hypothetical protein